MLNILIKTYYVLQWRWMSTRSKECLRWKLRRKKYELEVFMLDNAIFNKDISLLMTQIQEYIDQHKTNAIPIYIRSFENYLQQVVTKIKQLECEWELKCKILKIETDDKIPNYTLKKLDKLHKEYREELKTIQYDFFEILRNILYRLSIIYGISVGQQMPVKLEELIEAVSYERAKLYNYVIK